MLVKDSMTRNVVAVDPNAELGVAANLMLRSNISGLPVLDFGQVLVGIITKGDLLWNSALGPEEHRHWWSPALLAANRLTGTNGRRKGHTVSEVMTCVVVTTTEDASLGEAIALMRRHKVKRLPVTRSGRVIGMLTRVDLMRALAKLLLSPDRSRQDSDLSSAIRSRLADRGLGHDARVDVIDGIVELRGPVPDEQQRQDLHLACQDFPGVAGVHDHLFWIEPKEGQLLVPPGAEKAAAAVA